MYSSSGNSIKRRKLAHKALTTVVLLISSMGKMLMTPCIVRPMLEVCPILLNPLTFRTVGDGQVGLFLSTGNN